MSYSHDAAICTLVDCPLSVREGEWDFDCGDRTDAPFVTRLMRLCGPERCTPYKGDDLKVRMKEPRPTTMRQEGLPTRSLLLDASLGSLRLAAGSP
jgi:hypothetical protein